VIKPPAGFYEIGAVCSPEQLDKLGLTQAQLVEPARRGRRGFEFQLEEAAKGVDHAALGRVTMAYEVGNVDSGVVVKQPPLHPIEQRSRGCKLSSSRGPVNE
jgi:hypothetical protein